MSTRAAPDGEPAPEGRFKLAWAEMEARHGPTFDPYEEGKIALEESLGRVVFYKKLRFSRAQQHVATAVRLAEHP